VYREHLRRLYELRDENPLSPNSYFQNFEKTLDNKVARKVFCDVEAQLQGLDASAWNFLKQELAPLLATKDPQRGWEPLFNKLNQAKAYNYLARIGCQNIEFIPCSPKKNRKSPDLRAAVSTRKVLCEVKTINISRDEANARTHYLARGIMIRLDDGFFRKFQADMEHAWHQMATYCSDDNTQRIVYFILNFDDMLHECVDGYTRQIEQYLEQHPVSTLKVVLDMKPAYYYATP
jgi:hypothetical protein